MTAADMKSGAERELVIALVDLTGSGKHARHLDAAVFALLSDYYEPVGEIVEQGGGSVVKFMFDGAMLAYPGDAPDRAVLNLMTLRESGDAWLNERGVDSTHVIQAHRGTVIVENSAPERTRDSTCLGERGSHGPSEGRRTGRIGRAALRSARGDSGNAGLSAPPVS